MRGNRQPKIAVLIALRSIPARAGETAGNTAAGWVGAGLSPRVRGNPVAVLPERTGDRVYPRACGGTILLYPASQYITGLSPRVRGNHKQASQQIAIDRSIPARAGEPCPPPPLACSGRVYPRACGGTCPFSIVPASQPGLSPRVRGNRRAHRHWDRRPRSIPARAGEPYHTRTQRGCFWVYPRACGGTRNTKRIRHR